MDHALFMLTAQMGLGYRLFAGSLIGIDAHRVHGAIYRLAGDLAQTYDVPFISIHQ